MESTEPDDFQGLFHHKSTVVLCMRLFLQHSGLMSSITDSDLRGKLTHRKTTVANHPTQYSPCEDDHSLFKTLYICVTD